ncbi:MAG: hypothetical protein IIY21_27145 [Clostridiales bacterium]|nr:hypothetical protein [Clostridiales bacterium]
MNDFFYLNPFSDPADPEPILRDVFDGWYTGHGIFDVLATVADMPWKDVESVDSSVLDVAYFGNHSGGKFCAPLVKLVINTEGVVPSQARTMIAKIIVSKYLINWTKLWATNVASYSPIHNYDMHEERDLATTEDNIEDTDITLARTGTDAMQHGMVESTQHGRTNERVTSRYGLNTVDGQVKPSDQVDDTEGGTTVTTDSGTDTQTKNLLDTTDGRTVEDNEGTEHEEIYRYGNIGVTTTQKLLQEERDLWIWNYFNEIFKDLDKELALAFHDPCRV